MGAQHGQTGQHAGSGLPVGSELYRLILDTAVDGYWDWDVTTDTAVLNPRYCELLGYAPGTGFSSDLFLKLVHPDDRTGIMASIMASAESLQPWEHEYRAVIPGQGIKWLRGHARPMRQADGSTLWHGFITDITDRKLMEISLAASEERYRRVFEVESDALFLVSRSSGR